MSVTTKATIASFGGKLLKLSHNATTTRCEMNFNLYLPSQASAGQKVPLLIYLSGLTCTAENCSEKGFFQHGASKANIAVLYPDTSPRMSSLLCIALEEPTMLAEKDTDNIYPGGLNVEGENDAYDFGTGAGFYVDATKPPYNVGYNMYSYISEELPQTVFAAFPQIDSSNVSITGHSMGGHGALTLYLRNPGKYKSVSAFAPISNPINCPWGQKAFTGYFGEDQQQKWKEHDATELLKNYSGEKDKLKILIDVGTGDNFYKQGQLLPENFEKVAKEVGLTGDNFTIRYQADYDHSYYFMSSFADDHIAHAAEALGVK
ncbi:esterase D [Penicillium capsulatum]|uniref:S-formylglutathione hydrolase n=1 Tax=Penicillium capsulatum TaxID=69766 RepID=A0A9W9LYV4_9EURO|nr:esterase D [Penicillium capsulatum]